MTVLELGNDLNRRIEYAKAYYQKALVTKDPEEQKTHIETSILLGFSFLEGTISYIFKHFESSNKFGVFEKSIIEEKDIRIEHGIPTLYGTKYRSIEERVQFLHFLFSHKKFDSSSQWWGNLINSTKKRNNILHPKNTEVLTTKDVEIFLLSLIDTVNSLYKTVFNKDWPKSKLGLDTTICL